MLAAVRGGVGIPVGEDNNGVGFRVVYVPEPGSIVMLAGIALTVLLNCCWRKRA